MPEAQTPYDKDVAAYAAALAHFPEIAWSEKNYEAVRLHLVTVKKAIPPGFMGVSTDTYVAAIAALRSTLEVKQAPAPAYRMGELFKDDDEPAKKELSPLPPDRDPFRMQVDNDRAAKIDEIFAETCGHRVSPVQKMHEVSRIMAQTEADPELRDEHEIVYRGQRVSQGETATRRAANREHNAAVRAARQAAKRQGVL